MLPHRRLPAIVLLVALAASRLFADSPAPVLSLDAALKNFATAPAAAPAEPGASADASDALRSAGVAFAEWRNTQSQLANLQSYFDNNDYANAIRQARQYARQATTPEIRQRWQDLISALEAEQKKIETALTERINTALARAGEAALAARQPDQLDALIDELATLQENRSYSSPRLQRLYNRLSNGVSFLQQWQDMLASYATGDTENVRQTLRNLASSGYRDRPLTRSQILAYAAVLKLDNASVEAAFARMDPVLKQAAQTALAAKKATELDPILARLDELKDEYRNSYDSPLRRAQDRVENAIQFYRQWQDFLAAYESGDERDARQQLRNLASNSYRYRPIPRAEMLARGGQLADELGSEGEKLIAGLSWKNLASIRSRVAEAQEQAYGRRSTELANIVSELDRLVAAREALDAGKAGLGRAALRSGPTTTGSSCSANITKLTLPAAVVALRESWWFDAMPALTGLSSLPERQAGESAAAYAARQLQAALAAQDWGRAHRFALLERDLLPPDTQPCGEREKTTGANAAVALGAFLLAEKLERALQPAAAAVAYRDALAAGAPPALEEILITRLRALAGAPSS